MRIEQIFGWMKSIGGLRRTRFKGRQRTQLAAHLVGAAYNLAAHGQACRIIPIGLCDTPDPHLSSLALPASESKPLGKKPGTGSGTVAGCFFSPLLAS
jgi:hypothetical protein